PSRVRPRACTFALWRSPARWAPASVSTPISTGEHAMKRNDKEIIVADLAAKLKGASALYYTDFTGLNVKRMTDLRRRLKKVGVEYVVIKNTLALKAVNEGGFAGVRLHGPTGLVVAQDAIGAAKVLTDFAKENDQKPTVKGGIYEGAAIDAATVKKLATMPTRDEALSQ